MSQFSAILPNYNDADLLPQAIQSLLQQSEPFTEIIIVDDGSTDRSVEIIHQFMQQHRQIRLIKHATNQGVSVALNTGIEAAKGDYLLLCAADDVYHSHIIAMAKPILNAYPSVGLICGNAIVKRFDLAKAFHRCLPYPANTFISPTAFCTFANHRYVGFNGGGGMLMNRQAVLEAGSLQPALRWHSDWLLYFTLAFRHGIYYVDEDFVTITMRQNSYSEGKEQWNVQKKVMLHFFEWLEQSDKKLQDNFKNSALLPHYSPRYIPLFLWNIKARRFMTHRLLWKLFINNKFITRLGRLFPYRIILQARRLLRA